MLKISVNIGRFEFLVLMIRSNLEVRVRVVFTYINSKIPELIVFKKSFTACY